jgi:hypothetical protein
MTKEELQEILHQGPKTDRSVAQINSVKYAVIQQYGDRTPLFHRGWFDTPEEAEKYNWSLDVANHNFGVCRIEILGID